MTLTHYTSATVLTYFLEQYKMELKTQRKVKNLNDTNKVGEALTGLKFIFPVQRINMAQTQKTLYRGEAKRFFIPLYLKVAVAHVWFY